MQLNQAAATAAMVLSLSLFFSVLPPTAEAFNVTRMLAKYPEYSVFSHYLSLTHLADDINTRETITVCVVDNAAMADLLSKHLSLPTIKNVLSLHVFLDYYGTEKLHGLTNSTTSTASMYQATGTAPGSSGLVNITDLKGGKVRFGAIDNGGPLDASFVKSVEEQPYNISVIQISKVLSSPDAEAPTPEPAQVNITNVMSAHGCKVFAETLLASPAEKTFEDNLNSGLTVFCPGDEAMKSFLPKYKNLSADDKQSVLEYHAVPIYQTLSMLKSGNGPANTLATDGARKFSLEVQNDGQVVTLKTTVGVSRISTNLLDQDPVSIFMVNKVLLAPEIFKAELSPTPAPAPAPAKSKSKHKSPPAPASPAASPADGPAANSADQTAADNNGAVALNGGRFIGVCLSLLIALSLL